VHLAGTGSVHPRNPAKLHRSSRVWAPTWSVPAAAAPASCAHKTGNASPIPAASWQKSTTSGLSGEDLDAWTTAVDADDLPALDAFVDGLRMDLPAVVAGLILPCSNGSTGRPAI
jgi:hypothetical protein